MFRRLIMAIFRLYRKCSLSSYTKHTWAFFLRLADRASQYLTTPIGVMIPEAV